MLYFLGSVREVFDLVSTQVVSVAQDVTSFLYFLGGVVAFAPQVLPSGDDLECHKFTMSVVE